MTTAAQAIAKAKATAHWTIGMCDQFVAVMYGFDSSGYATAVKNWQATPASLKHAGDWSAPAGALMYWGGGSTGAGHVAISLGNGQIITTDATPGNVGTVSARTPTDKWGHQYLGWTYPYFQGKQATTSLGGVTGTAPSVGGSTPVGNNATQISADSVTSGFLGAIMAPFEFALKFVIWGGELVVGLVLMLIGLVLFSRGTKS